MQRRARRIDVEDAPVEIDQRHAQRRVLERGTEPLFGLAVRAFGPLALGDVAGRDDDTAVDVVGAEVLADALERPVVAVARAEAELDRLLRAPGAGEHLAERDRGRSARRPGWMSE